MYMHTRQVSSAVSRTFAKMLDSRRIHVGCGMAAWTLYYDEYNHPLANRRWFDCQRLKPSPNLGAVVPLPMQICMRGAEVQR